MSLRVLEMVLDLWRRGLGLGERRDFVVGRLERDYWA